MANVCVGCNPPRRCPLGGPIDCPHCKAEPVRTCTLNATEVCGCTYEHYQPGSVRFTPCHIHNTLNLVEITDNVG